MATADTPFARHRAAVARLVRDFPRVRQSLAPGDGPGTPCASAPTGRGMSR